MPKQRTIVSIFLSSPSNLGAERALIEKVVRGLNSELRPARDLEFEIQNWRTSVVPGVGSEPQAVITSQIKYDVYIGMLGTHFGTPTKSAGSGTEEEFRDALKIYLDSPELVRVLFYFATKVDDVFEINPEQLGFVKAFKESLPDEGVLYGTFASLDSLQELVTGHLRTLIYEQWTGSDWKVLTPASKPSQASSMASNLSPMPVISVVENENDEGPGLLELTVLGVQASKDLSGHLGRMTALVTDFSGSISDANSERDAALASGDPATALKFIDQVALVMQEFARQAQAEIPLFASSMTEQLVVIEQLGSLLFDEKTGSVDELRGILDSFSLLLEAIRGARGQMATFGSTVDGAPVMTKRFRTGKKAITAAIDEVLSSYTFVLGQADALVARMRVKVDRLSESTS